MNVDRSEQLQHDTIPPDLAHAETGHDPGAPAGLAQEQPIPRHFRHHRPKTAQGGRIARFRDAPPECHRIANRNSTHYLDPAQTQASA